MPTALTLPNIDISPFLGERTPSSLLARQATAAQVHDACTRYGFFYLSGIESVVSQEEMDEGLSVAREFFGRPEEEKAKLRIKKGDGARGWQMIGENVTQYKADWHEGWDAYKPLSPSEEDATKLLHGPNQWPTHPSSFRPVLERWVEKMHVLGYALTEATALALGIDVEGDSDEWRKMRAWVEDPFWVLRTIGYPPLPADAEGISCGAHKDYGYYTLLHADSTLGALQVFLRDSSSSYETGGTWINADPVPGTFVVNIGEMVEVLSAGLYKATLHRVVHKAPSYRVSIPFFFEPSYDALIEPLPSALRLRSQLSSSSSTTEAPIKPVHYGTFLASKVAGNFALEKEY
ncbi:hypothetical protein NBRC10512_005560 [Rhodotorula toruloides]|uniref:RHTO0S03e03488g1_1 n=2 Tax=Rhodotorula toruloides TaxID=5286 RepID=A0A061ALS6_RHOTO|nr:oxoglutarate/iron-dependent oxygenase [Rhodotorula toruloides NP11]EMS25761.1 oxoglutarate/iron-dependent oxygenase [Rhodotorula toruloides NP11]CDR38098.1 RHTO0S03e03488g1_1 [Rhodotorula toruloides]